MKPLLLLIDIPIDQLACLLLHFLANLSRGLSHSLQLVFILLEVLSKLLEFLGDVLNGLQSEAVCDEFLIVGIVDIYLQFVDIIEHRRKLKIMTIRSQAAVATRSYNRWLDHTLIPGIL